MTENKITVIILALIIAFFGCGNNTGNADERGSAPPSAVTEDSAAEVKPAGYSLKDVDLSGATDEQKEVIFKILSSYDCPCGRGRGDLVTCRNSGGEECGISKRAAVYVRDRVLAGEPPEKVSSILGAQIKNTEAKIKRQNEMMSKVYEIDTSDAQSLGKPGAKLHLIVFSDFECPYCIKAHKILEEVASEFPDDLRYTFMHYPLNMHKNAVYYAAAAEAAGKQGKFFEMASLIVGGRGAYSDERMIGFAEELGLDIGRFKADMKSEEVRKIIDSHKGKANEYGISSTPTMILNKRLIRKKYTVEFFRDLFNSKLKEL